jgi:GT2 family glycosyltransferase
VKKDNNTIDVSIILVNWNCGKMIVDCVESLTQTIKNHSYEIIIVDNKSKDNSLRLLKKKFGNKLIYIENKKNNYFAKANNQGYRVSSGEYIFILNPDTIATGGSIDRMMDFIRSSKEEVLTCTLLNKDGSIQYLHRSFPSFIKIISHFLKTRCDFFSFLPPVRSYLLLNNNYQKNFRLEQAAGTAILLSRKLLKKLGYLFDENNFPLLFNDVDLCYRINKKQGKILCFADVKIYHLKGASTKKLDFDNYSLHYSVSALKFFKKYNLWLNYFLIAVAIKTFFINYFLLTFIFRKRKTPTGKKQIFLRQILLERFDFI